MRRPSRAGLTAALLAVALGAAGCGSETGVPVPGVNDAVKSAALVRAERRAYDGAPPVIAHENFQIACVECHDLAGMEVEGVGYAPPSPHENTLGMSAVSRCRQCHVFAVSEATFAANAFVPLRQNLRAGSRLNPLAPPRLPHDAFMRENCVACHSGPAAREEIRTSHPERARCGQCHVAVTATSVFKPDGGGS